MSWFDKAFDDWRKLLPQRTTVCGRPNPEAVELLHDIDLLLKTSPQIKTDLLLRVLRRLILPIAACALVYVMFSRCGHNGIALSARVTSLSFTLDSDGEAQVLKELSLKKLVAQPIDVFRPCAEKLSPLGSSNLDHEGGTATILPTKPMNLNAVMLPVGTRVTIGLAKRQQELEVILEYPTMSKVSISGTASNSCSFDLLTRAKALKLTLQVAESELSEPIDGQIPISAIEFTLPRVVQGRAISSINAGLLSFSDIPDLKYRLDRGVRLSMDLRKGTLADLRVVDREIALLLQGDAARVRLGYRDQDDITPTTLDWLRTKSRNIELWLALVGFTAILFGVGLPQLIRS